MRAVSIPPPAFALDSLAYRVLPPDPMKERIATKNTSTPMPPIQCERQRQNIRLWGKSAKLENTLEPVVVSPLVDSKNASGNPQPRISA